MASQLHVRPHHRAQRRRGSGAALRIFLATTLALLMLPLLGSGASAEEGVLEEPLTSEVVDPAATEPQPAPEVLPEPPPVLDEEPVLPLEEVEAEPSRDSSQPMIAEQEEAVGILELLAEPECDPGTLVGPFPVSGGDPQRFEIDGNIDPCEGSLDWTSPGITPKFVDGVDDASQFQGSSKEFEHPSGWTTQEAVSPAKADMVDVYFHSARATNGDVYALVGFSRAATNGTTEYDLEFNKRPNSSSNPPRPVRSPDDLLVDVQQRGNAGENIFDIRGAYFWTLQGDSTAWHVDKDKDTPDCIPVSGYTPAAGWCPILPLPAAFTGATSADDFFAEGALNISALFGPGNCIGSFGAVNIRSRASDSDTAALADWVATPGVSVPGTCGSIMIEKRDADDPQRSPIGGATFTITPQPVPGGSGTSVTVTDNDTVVTSGEVADMDSRAGYLEVDPVEPGIYYTVTETTAPANYLLPPPSEVSPCAEDDGSRCLRKQVTSGQTATFVFEDKRIWQPLSVQKTATGYYDVSYDWDIEKSVDRTEAEIASGGAPFDYTVTVTEGAATKSGWEVKGSVTVSNPNDAPVQATLVDTIDDALGTCRFDGDPDRSTAALEVTVPKESDGPGAYPYTCTFSGEPAAAGTNTVEVQWDRRDYPQSQADVDGPQTPEEREEWEDSHIATDTADYGIDTIDEESHKSVTVTDSLYDEWDTNPWVITWGDNDGDQDPENNGVYTREYTLEHASDPGTCTEYSNTAEVRGDDVTPGDQADQGYLLDSSSQTVEVCVGADLVVEKDAGVTYNREFTWDVEKTGPGTRVIGETVDPQTGEKTYTTQVEYEVTVRQAGIVDSEQTLGGTITVTNPNDWQDIDATVKDIVDLPGVTCEITGGHTATDPELVDADPADGFQLTVPRKTYGAAGEENEGDFVEGSNVATLTYRCTGMSSAQYDGDNTATAEWSTVDFPSPTGKASDTVAINDDGPTGAGLNETVTLIDDMLPGQPFGPFDYHTHDPADTVTYTVDLGTTGQGTCTTHDNTATLQGTDVSDTFSVTVCAPAVSKTADATFDRTYPWTIAKAVLGEDRRVIVEDGEASFQYQVIATPGEPVDSGYGLSGEITLFNPAGSEEVTVDVSDEVGIDGAQCTVHDGELVVERVTLAAGETAVLDYDCSLPDGFEPPGEDATNTVVASWGDEQVTGTRSVEFEVAEEIDKTIHVTDDLYNPLGLPAMTATWERGEDGKPKAVSFLYTLSFDGELGECAVYDNTASIVELPEQRATASVTVCVQDRLDVVKDATATYDRTYHWKIDKFVDDATREVAEGTVVNPDYGVKVTPDGSTDSGWKMFGTITVSNPNDPEDFPEGDITTTVTDVPGVGEGAQCVVTYGEEEEDAVGVVIPAGEHVDFDYSCTFSSVSEEEYEGGTNTATARWVDADGETQRETGAARDLDFAIDERVNETVRVYDNKVTLPSGEEELLGTWKHSDGEHVFTYDDVPLAGEAGECKPYRNTASIRTDRTTVLLDRQGAPLTDSQTVTVCVEKGLAISKTVQASVGRTYHWLIDKSVDRTSVEIDGGHATFNYTVKATPNGSTDSGYAMSGTITVTNPNDPESNPNASITGTVTDVPSVGGGASCTVTGGQSVTLAPGESKTLPYGCTFTSTPTGGSNKATVTWTGPDEKQHSASTAQVPVTFTPTGHANSSVTVTDSMTTPSVLGTATWNAAGTPTSFSYSLTHAGVDNRCVGYTNTATITQTGQSDSQAVTVCDEGALVVTKTVDATYDRTYEWDITKVADRERLDTPEGGSGTVSYTVGVTPTGFEDSGWEMGGAVTVSNPNTFKAVTVQLTDVPDLGGGAACSFDEKEDFVVEAGETRTFTYSCSFTGQPAYDGTNTVVVDWGSGSTSATVEVPFERDEAFDETVTVTDDLLEPSELGQVTWDAGGATVQFEYSLEHEGVVNECETVTNTATIVETGQDAQADVLVCGPEVLPAEEERPPAKPRPPVVLPETGAPGDVGILTTLGGLLSAFGALLMMRRRRHVS